MTKPTMALLSTWGEPCGIAHYSYFLKRALDDHFDITVFPLPRTIMVHEQSHAPADQYISVVSDKLKHFDVTNIQLELGLFGRALPKKMERVLKLLGSVNNLVVAFHSIRQEESLRTLETLRSIRRLGVARGLYHTAKLRMSYRLWRQFYRAISRRARLARVGLITHNQRDARALQQFVHGPSIFHHPLSYMDSAFIAALPELATRSKLPSLLPRGRPDVRYIGVFGFHGEHKGYETAINALRFMPQNYELLMFSGVHELAITRGQMPPFLARLINMVIDRNLERRVHFIGTVDDDDVMIGMMVCDAVLCPYLETGQSASGPASLAIELDRPLFCSRITPFIELKKYFPDHLTLCDIGNPIEYAQKIVRLTENRKDREVAAMRWVYYPPVQKNITILDTVENYLRAAGVGSPPTSERLVV